MNKIKNFSKPPCTRHRLSGTRVAQSFLFASILAGCATAPKPESPILAAPSSAQAKLATAPTRPTPALPPAGSGRGAYYQNDGPGDNPPSGLFDLPNAEPRIEPLSKGASRPYVVFGKSYTPITDGRVFVQRGVGSWYGKKFHGQKTASGELYDMYKMTAAHPTLPIPSYARITNVQNGQQVIVRINDRGPFHANRIVDLSYTAAMKLGLLIKGSHEVEIERILPDEIARLALSQRVQNTGIGKMPAELAPRPAAMTQTASVVKANTELSAVAAITAGPDPFAIAASGSFTESQSVQSNAAPVVSITPNRAGFYLQLGAYAQANNAESVRVRLAQNWPAAAAPAPEVVQSGVIYRLYSGPFSTRSEAATAAQLVLEGGSSRPLIVQR